MVNTENAKITRGKGNCFEYILNLSTVKELKSCELWKRCTAHILDIFVVTLFAFLILKSVTLIIVQSRETYGILIINLAILAYFIYFERSSRQTTAEKKWTNLIVTNLEGKKISFERAFFRYFIRGMTGLILVGVDVAANGVAIVSEHLGFYFLIPLITYAPILFMDLKQGVHDLLADMVVLKSLAVSSEGNEE
ncbi:MAG: RDD family protein [Methanosarcina sp.]|uniref:RDD family protein n=1 Tax=Methanosarcina sp. TaxID=2213 RepID=UPI003BB7902A